MTVTELIAAAERGGIFVELFLNGLVIAALPGADEWLEDEVHARQAEIVVELARSSPTAPLPKARGRLLPLPPSPMRPGARCRVQ